MILFGGNLLSFNAQPAYKVANWAPFQPDFCNSNLECLILLGHCHMCVRKMGERLPGTSSWDSWAAWLAWRPNKIEKSVQQVGSRWVQWGQPDSFVRVLAWNLSNPFCEDHCLIIYLSDSRLAPLVGFDYRIKCCWSHPHVWCFNHLETSRLIDLPESAVKIQIHESKYGMAINGFKGVGWCIPPCPV